MRRRIIFRQLYIQLHGNTVLRISFNFKIDNLHAFLSDFFLKTLQRRFTRYQMHMDHLTHINIEPAEILVQDNLLKLIP